MAKTELKEAILYFLERDNELRTADLVRFLISKASPLTVDRYVKLLEKDGKIVMNKATKKWMIK